MTEVGINKFYEFLRTYIDLPIEIKILEIKKLPQAGYGSTMTKVAIELDDHQGSKRKLNLVAKLIPSDEFVRKFFQIEFTFKQEVRFYDTILPALKNFEEKEGVAASLNMFPDFFGARLSLDKNEVDEDALLVLSDLSVEGYVNSNRPEGFYLDGAKRILKDLARFQGTAIALKLKNPELFDEKVKVFCRYFHFDEGVTFTNSVHIVLKENEACAPLIDKIGPWPCAPPKPREPYATIAHTDLWVNNTMQKYVDQKIESNVIVDFQIYDYRSCASDVFFFLWTSCRKEVLEHHLDYLLKYYHDNLIETLEDFNCDISQFSYDKFLEEIKLESVYEFGHSLSFVVIVKDKPLIDEENLKNKVTREEVMAKLPQRVKDFIYFMVLECDKRGWLH